MFSLGIIKKQSSSEQIINYILGKIEKQELKSGDKLLGEREFAQQLGVSRVPLREAISALSVLGILKSRQGEGTFVNVYDPSILGKTIRTYSLLNRSLIDEVFEARTIMEAEAAKLAASNRTEKDLDLIETAIRNHGESVERYKQHELEMEDVLEQDNNVHLGIAAATHNNFFLQIIDAIRQVGQGNHIFDKEYTVNPNHFEEAVGYHWNIYEAIRKQDGEAAYHAMSAHIQFIQSALDIAKLKEVFDQND